MARRPARIGWWVGGAAVVALVLAVWLLREQAAAESAAHAAVERAAVQAYVEKYAAVGVQADSSGLWGDCAVVDLFEPGQPTRPVSVVMTRDSARWVMVRSARGGDYFDADDAGSLELCRALARGVDDAG